MIRRKVSTFILLILSITSFQSGFIKIKTKEYSIYNYRSSICLHSTNYATLLNEQNYEMSLESSTKYFDGSGLTLHSDGISPPYFAINSFLSLSLLQLEDLEKVIDIVVNSNYKSISSSILERSIFDRMKILLLNKIDDQLRKNLKYKVREGFIARAYNRLANPSYSLSDESIVVILIDKRDPEKVIGVIEVYPTKEPYLCNLAISSSSRRQGHARTLCKFSEIIVTRLWGKRAITLHVERNNIPARRLYESMNYTQSDLFNENNLREPEKRNLIYYRKNLDYLCSTGSHDALL